MAAVEAGLLHPPPYAEKKSRKSGNKYDAFEPDRIILATGSPRRKDFLMHVLTPAPGHPSISIEFAHGGDEDESQTTSQIAKGKIARATQEARKRGSLGRRTIRIASDVRIGVIGHEPKSKPASIEEIQVIFRNAAQVARESHTDPYYYVEAANPLQKPRKKAPNNKPAYAFVTLDLNVIEQIGNNPEALDAYRRAFEETEILPDMQHTSQFGGTGVPSILALARMDGVKSINVNGSEIPRYIEEANGRKLNPQFIDEFQLVFSLQAVGFSPEVFDAVILPHDRFRYSSYREAISNSQWIEEATRRALGKNSPSNNSVHLSSRRSEPKAYNRYNN